MRVLAAVFVLGLTLATAGCARQGPFQEPSRTPATTDASPAARVGTLPDCAGFEIPDTPEVPAGCQMQSAAGLVRVTYAAAPDSADADYTLTVNLIGPNDAIKQSVTIDQAGRVFAPEFNDVNADGSPDLLVTTGVGNVNAQQIVYLFDKAGGAFVNAGEISGTGMERLPDGLIAVSARDSAASYSVAYYRVDAFKLLNVANASVAFNEKGALDRCEVSPGETAGAFESLKLTPAQADTKFCGYAKEQFTR